MSKRKTTGQQHGTDPRNPPARRAGKGFTLLELMVALAVVALLAAVAIPAYTQYTVRGNKVTTQQLMQQIANRAQQYRLDTRNYPANLAALNVTVPDEVADYYDLSLTADNNATPPEFSITAAPVAGTMQAGEPTLTLHSSGSRTPAQEW